MSSSDSEPINDEQYEQEFEHASSGASTTYPMQCSALRKNGHVVLKGRPCKIMDMSTSKTGKHGHAKVHLVGVDIFTGKKYEDLCPSTHNMDVPNVSRTDYTLLDIDGEYVSLMLSSGDTKDDVRMPEGDMGKELRAAFDDGRELLVSVIASMNEEAIISFKDAPRS
jgi:translation initiation factor 5A